MNITLDPKWEKFIAEKVKCGDFPNADSVIELALERLQDEQDDLRAAIQIGADQIARGELCELTMEQIKAKCRRELAERKRA